MDAAPNLKAKVANTSSKKFKEINVIRLIVGIMQTNCYIVFDNFKKCMIIDPGDDAEYIKNEINRLELTPTAIIATHGHFDHAMSAFDLQVSYNIPFYMSKKDYLILISSLKNSKKFFNFDPGPPPHKIKFISENVLEIEKFNIRIFETPGHTPGSITIYIKDSGILISGDLIFEGSQVGRYDFYYSNKSDLFKSIKNILKFNGDTIVYPGHGKSFRLKNFKYARMNLY